MIYLTGIPLAALPFSDTNEVLHVLVPKYGNIVLIAADTNEAPPDISLN